MPARCPAAPLNRIVMLTDYVAPEERIVACPNQDVVYGVGSARPRTVAGRDPGAGLRRPLLGLSGRRPAHRQLRAARQDVRHHARLLPAGRPELEGRGAQGHHPGLPRPRPIPASSRRASSMDDTPEDKQAVQPRAAADHDVPAGGIRRHDEEHRLEHDYRSCRRRDTASAEIAVGSARRTSSTTCRRARRCAAAAGRGGALRAGAARCSKRRRAIRRSRRR